MVGAAAQVLGDSDVDEAATLEGARFDAALAGLEAVLRLHPSVIDIQHVRPHLQALFAHKNLCYVPTAGKTPRVRVTDVLAKLVTLNNRHNGTLSGVLAAIEELNSFLRAVPNRK